MITSIYNNIAARLKLKLDTNYNGSLKKLKHIDLFNDQINQYEREHPFDLPAIFIQLQFTNLRTKAGQLYQWGDVNVTLHVLQYSLDSDLKASDILLYLEEVNKAIHGTQGTNYNNLVRTGIEITNTNNQMYYHTISYTAGCWDGSASRDRDMTQVTIPGMNIKKNP
jgi:hypothetical protein